MPKKPELFEAIPFELVGPITEVEHNGERLMQVTGVMHRANELNGNHRIYPASVLSREVQKLKERLASGESVFSQADQPVDGVSRISDSAAMLMQVEYTPTDEVIGTALILPTQKGKDLAAIVRAGGKVGISVRGFGTTRPGECAGQQGEVVQEDYQLVTYDFVIGHQNPRPAVPSMASKLTTKQEKFADSVVANRNQTQAAREAGYAGGPRQLAVQGSRNMRNPKIRERIDEMLAGLGEPSVKRLEEGLDATRRRAFLTKAGDVVYTDPEPDHKIRTRTANSVLDRLERRSNRHATRPDVAPENEEVAAPREEVVSQGNTKGGAEPNKSAIVDPTDRMLIREAAEIDRQIGKLSGERTENPDQDEGCKS